MYRQNLIINMLPGNSDFHCEWMRVIFKKEKWESYYKCKVNIFMSDSKFPCEQKGKMLKSNSDRINIHKNNIWIMFFHDSSQGLLIGMSDDYFFSGRHFTLLLLRGEESGKMVACKKISSEGLKKHLNHWTINMNNSTQAKSAKPYLKCLSVQ